MKLTKSGNHLPKFDNEPYTGALSKVYVTKIHSVEALRNGVVAIKKIPAVIYGWMKDC